MKVRAVKSFGGTVHGHKAEGSVFELPDGVNWLEAGLVVPVESAMLEPARPRKTGIGGKGVEWLAGIGPDKAEGLAAADIHTIADLAAASISQLSSVSGIGEVTAEKLQSAAREALRG